MTTANDPAVTAAQSQALYAAVDAFAQAVSVHIPQWDRDRAVDQRTLEQAAAIGLTGIEVPQEDGGLGLGFRNKVRAMEIISRTSMALAFSLTNTHNVAARIAAAGSETHRRELLPDLLSGHRSASTALTEPGAGSDFGAISTSAQQTADGWVLNGEKAWITNAATSDVIICYAQTDPDAGPNGIASFLIDGTQPGFHRVAPYDLSGGHLIGTGGFRLENYRAEFEDLLTEPGAAFSAALESVNGARIYVSAMCNAMVHASLETAVAYGSSRQAFGKPLLKHQGLAWSLANVANQLEASQLLTERAIDSMESDELPEVILSAAHAKKFATEMAEPAIAACIQAMGAEGLRDKHPLGRHLAEARIANFVDGSTEIQTERIARTLASVYRRPIYDHSPLVDTERVDESARLLEQAAPADDRADSYEPVRATPPLPGENHRRPTAPASPPAQLPPLPPDSLRNDYS